MKKYPSNDTFMDTYIFIIIILISSLRFELCNTLFALDCSRLTYEQEQLCLDFLRLREQRFQDEFTEYKKELALENMKPVDERFEMHFKPREDSNSEAYLLNLVKNRDRYRHTKRDC
jgi:hypothetical protein